jgi:hypothetical protein
VSAITFDPTWLNDNDDGSMADSVTLVDAHHVRFENSMSGGFGNTGDLMQWAPVGGTITPPTFIAT